MFHDVDFLHVVSKLNGLTMLDFPSGVGFILFVWPLCGVLLGVLIYYFTLLRGVSGAMQHSCLSHTGHLLARRDYIFFLALASSVLIGVGRRYGLY